MTKEGLLSAKLPPPALGTIFGNWEIISSHEERRNEHTLWTVLCRRCKDIYRVDRSTLRDGRSTICRFCARTRPRRRKSEFDAMPTWELRERWRHAHRNMVRRCDNPRDAAYANYGGRGILIHSSLRSRRHFAAFVMTLPGWDDLSLTLDRIDNDGHYWPGNIRMATPSEQTRNRRPRERWTKKGGAA